MATESRIRSNMDIVREYTDAIDFYRLANGMIVEEWAADDSTAILHQAGAYTPPCLGGRQS
jgi:hypothetical protein